MSDAEIKFAKGKIEKGKDEFLCEIITDKWKCSMIIQVPLGNKTESYQFCIDALKTLDFKDIYLNEILRQVNETKKQVSLMFN